MNDFRFKQFTITHQGAAQKVGTDGVLLGAWANCTNCHSILDVGSGTGLIALMLAQRSQAQLVGIDIDAGAFENTRLNFENSPFVGRLIAHHLGLADFARIHPALFDLVVSNPPYFVDSLKSPGHARSLARHTEGFSHAELLHRSAQLTTETGRLCVVLPFFEGAAFEQDAPIYGWFCVRKTVVYSTQTKPPKRVLLEFAKQWALIECNELCIHDTSGGYSTDYMQLTEAFYL